MVRERLRSRLIRPGPRCGGEMHAGRHPIHVVTLLIISLLCAFPAMAPVARGGALQAPVHGAAGEREIRQTASREGVAVEMSMVPLEADKPAKGGLMEGETVSLRFKITDTATGVPMAGLRPAAWLDPIIEQKGSQGSPYPPPSCEDKIKQFLQGSLAYQPEIDLNTYFILAMNEKPSISVINPQLGFYISKMVTTVLLQSPGEDWAQARDGKWIYVTMPLAGQVAVVDTATWNVVDQINAGPNPIRIVFQPDEKYLWVGNDTAGSDAKEGGVMVLDPEKRKPAARFNTGAGRHEMAFADDSSTAVVTNSESGTVSVIDVRKMRKAKDIATGSLPVSVAYSSRSQAFYVAHEGDGRIAVVMGDTHELASSMETKPGLKAIRFSPDGRWGFAANPKENVVYILDSSVNRILHAVEVDKGPDKISFTKAFAYVRCAGADQVNAIPLNDLDKGESVPVLRFSAGQNVAAGSQDSSSAEVIVPTPEGDVVLVANPADRTIYYYMEGMLAPMGSFQNYGSVPRAVMVVDRSLRERSPGVYSNTLRLPHGGKFDVAFLLDSPRIYQCFEAVVRTNPVLARKRQLPLKIDFLTRENSVKVGENLRLRFRVTDPNTNRPREGLTDLGVLTFRAPGTNQVRAWATPEGDGIYGVDISAPRIGNYYVFFQCNSLNVRYNQLPHLTIRATAEE